MRIVGFGDSFITQCHNDYPSYTNLISEHYSSEFISHGISGSGSWEAFFQFEEHFDNQDVVMFAWSNTSRLYHHAVKDICFSGAERNKNSDNPVWQAANMYYNYLYSAKKSHYELKAFYYWFDDYLSQFKNTKFIHMWGFPADKINQQYYYTWAEHEKYDYLHRFKIGMEVRPALIYLSYLDGWPNDLANETRPNHFTNKMHRYLADILIKSIDEYENGRDINIVL